MMTRAELAFSALDRDNSGYISNKELRKIEFLNFDIFTASILNLNAPSSVLTLLNKIYLNISNQNKPKPVT